MAAKPGPSLNQIDTPRPDPEHDRAPVGWSRWLLTSSAVTSRLVVIFGVLAVVKVILIVGLRKHLEEIHWRYSTLPLTWLNTFAFYAVGAVMVYSLIQLGRQCQPAGVRAVRAANAMIVGLGGLLIFLLFHEGDKNYLYPVMTGVLKFSDLWAYLSLNLFFRPPYLAVWILGYVSIYYVLVRLKRERQIFTVTAILAGLYWVLCWQELRGRESDLWVILLFGVLALFQLHGGRRMFHPGWLLLPLSWAVFIWGLFRLVDPDVGDFPPYFLLLAGCLVVLFVIATLVAWRKGILHPWAGVAVFYFIAVLLLSSSFYPMAENLNNLMGYAAKFPHYFLGELFLAGLLAVAAISYERFRPGRSLWWLDVAGLILILLALVDLRLTQLTGVRLGWDILAFGNDPKMMWRLARPYLPALGGVMIVVALVYGVMARLMARWQQRGNSPGAVAERQLRGWCLVGCFALLAVLGLVITKPDNAEGQGVLRLVQSSPLWKRAVNHTPSPKEFRQMAARLGMPEWGRTAKVATATHPRELNVLLIFQESTYNEHLSLFSGDIDTQPLLSRYQDRMELFPNFFSSFAGSIQARFATFTGLYPVADFSQFTLNHVPVKSIFEILDDHGYECSLFYSSYLDYTGFRNFLHGRQLAATYDADTMPGAQSAERVSWGLPEESTAQAIRQQLKSYAGSGRRFFLTYIPAAPHQPFDKIPKEFRKFKLGQMGDFSPQYLNELLYMDSIIASLLDELKATGLLAKTLVVITADHGEMLGQNGGPIGHGWRLTPRLTNVPLILMDPEHPEYRINPVVGSQVDLLPTLLDVLGLPVPVGELYQGQSLYALPATADRRIYLNSYEQFAVIQGQEMQFGSRLEASAPLSDTVQRISDRGAVTVFRETNDPAVGPMDIPAFDDFQSSLLRNYSFYRDAFRSVGSTNALRTSR